MIDSIYAPPERMKEDTMSKYYHHDIYLLNEEELFQSRDTMIEYLRDNWEEYCLPIGGDRKLISIQDWESDIIWSYSTQEDDGTVESFENRASYKTVQNTWLISELERMASRV